MRYPARGLEFFVDPPEIVQQFIHTTFARSRPLIENAARESSFRNVEGESIRFISLVTTTTVENIIHVGDVENRRGPHTLEMFYDTDAVTNATLLFIIFLLLAITFYNFFARIIIKFFFIHLFLCLIFYCLCVK